MPTIRRTLTRISDPGHGWLSVSHDDIRALGLANLITGYSYMDRTRVYLEEDLDMGTFLSAAREAGWIVRRKSSYNPKTNIRNLGNYNPYWIHNPLRTGSVVRLHDGMTGTYQVRPRPGVHADFVQTEKGSLYTITPSNPFAYILPPQKEPSHV